MFWKKKDEPQMPTAEELNKYEKDYSDESFWEKVKTYALKAGEKVIRKALELYYVAKNSGTPITIKAAIIAALGYFISPVDAIPDFTPVIGYTDDYGALLAAAATSVKYITSDVKKQADDKLKDWFG